MDNTTVTGARATVHASVDFGGTTNGNFIGSTSIEINGVQLAGPTTYFLENAASASNFTTGTSTRLVGGNQSDSTAFDGVKFQASAGTISGVYAIYGYSKTV